MRTVYVSWAEETTQNIMHRFQALELQGVTLSSHQDSIILRYIYMFLKPHRGKKSVISF